MNSAEVDNSDEGMNTIYDGVAEELNDSTVWIFFWTIWGKRRSKVRQKNPAGLSISLPHFIDQDARFSDKNYQWEGNNEWGITKRESVEK